MPGHFIQLLATKLQIPASEVNVIVAEQYRRDGWITVVGDQITLNPEITVDPDLIDRIRVKAYCDAPVGPSPWVASNDGGRLTLLNWNEPRGKWNERNLPRITWTLDPSGCNLSAGVVEAVIRSAFSEWADASAGSPHAQPSVGFSQLAGGNPADIHIQFGGSEIYSQFGQPNGVIGWGAYPLDGETSAIKFDSAETWTRPLLLRVALHEIGHALGITHSTSPECLMYPFEGVDGIDQETRLAFRAIYGLPGQVKIENRGSEAAPALVAWNDIPVSAWRGTGDDKRLWWSTWLGDWTPQEVAVGASSHGPALAIHGERLWMAWKGINDDHAIFLASRTLTGSWSVQRQVAGRGTSGRPALASHGGKLWMAWRGIGSDEGIWVSSSQDPDGRWTDQVLIKGAASSHGPSLAVRDNELLLAWKGAGADHNIYLTHAFHPDAEWDQPERLEWYSDDYTATHRPGTEAEPSLFMRAGKLWAVWRGIGDDRNLYFSVRDSRGWSGQLRLAGASEFGPAATFAGGKTMFLWRGIGSDRGLFTSWF